MQTQKINVRGKFNIQQIRDGKLVAEWNVQNGVTNAGKDAILDIMFHAASQITTWYLGLIDNSGYTALAAGDTMLSHGGWNEFTTYDETNRQEWTEDAAASQVITNSTPVQFTIGGSGTVKGLFCVSNNTKGGSSGTLWATALFTTPATVVDGDIFKVTYSVTAS